MDRARPDCRGDREVHSAGRVAGWADRKGNIRINGGLFGVFVSLLGLWAADGINIGSIVLAVVGGLILLVGFRMVCKNA